MDRASAIAPQARYKIRIVQHLFVCALLNVYLHQLLNYDKL